MISQGGAGVSGGGASIAEDMYFPSISARNTFTNNNPSRIVQGIACAVENGTAYDYYQWDENNTQWRDANLIFQGKKGDKGDDVTAVTVDSNGDLIVTLSDGTTLNAGRAKGEDGDLVYQLLPTADYGNFFDVDWSSLGTNIYGVTGDGSEFANTPFPTSAGQEYSFEILLVNEPNQYSMRVTLMEAGENSGRDAILAGKTKIQAQDEGWNIYAFTSDPGHTDPADGFVLKQGSLISATDSKGTDAPILGYRGPDNFVIGPHDGSKLVIISAKDNAYVSRESGEIKKIILEGETVDSIVAGAGITVNNSNPARPIISASGNGGGVDPADGFELKPNADIGLDSSSAVTIKNNAGDKHNAIDQDINLDAIRLGSQAMRTYLRTNQPRMEVQGSGGLKELAYLEDIPAPSNPVAPARFAYLVKEGEYILTEEQIQKEVLLQVEPLVNVGGEKITTIFFPDQSTFLAHYYIPDVSPAGDEALKPHISSFRFIIRPHYFQTEPVKIILKSDGDWLPFVSSETLAEFGGIYLYREAQQEVVQEHTFAFMRPLNFNASVGVQGWSFHNTFMYEWIPLNSQPPAQEPISRLGTLLVDDEETAHIRTGPSITSTFDAQAEEHVLDVKYEGEGLAAQSEVLVSSTTQTQTDPVTRFVHSWGNSSSVTITVDNANLIASETIVYLPEDAGPGSVTYNVVFGSNSLAKSVRRGETWTCKANALGIDWSRVDKGLAVLRGMGDRDIEIVEPAVKLFQYADGMPYHLLIEMPGTIDNTARARLIHEFPKEKTFVFSPNANGRTYVADVVVNEVNQGVADADLDLGEYSDFPLYVMEPNVVINRDQRASISFPANMTIDVSNGFYVFGTMSGWCGNNRTSGTSNVYVGTQDNTRSPFGAIGLRIADDGLYIMDGTSTAIQASGSYEQMKFQLDDGLANFYRFAFYVDATGIMTYYVVSLNSGHLATGTKQCTLSNIGTNPKLWMTYDRLGNNTAAIALAETHLVLNTNSSPAEGRWNWRF